jgi:hypothetical protein
MYPYIGRANVRSDEGEYGFQKNLSQPMQHQRYYTTRTASGHIGSMKLDEIIGEEDDDVGFGEDW